MESAKTLEPSTYVGITFRIKLSPSPVLASVGANLRANIMVLPTASVKKWINIVKLYAALSAVKIKELIYVNGKIPIGNTK